MTHSHASHRPCCIGGMLCLTVNLMHDHAMRNTNHYNRRQSQTSSTILHCSYHNNSDNSNNDSNDNKHNDNNNSKNYNNKHHSAYSHIIITTSQFYNALFSPTARMNNRKDTTTKHFALLAPFCLSWHTGARSGERAFIVPLLCFSYINNEGSELVVVAPLSGMKAREGDERGGQKREREVAKRETRNGK